jgi:NADH-quinone oxidoreductase subunit G
MGIAHGDRVTVNTDGSRINAIATLRAAVPEGTVFLESGLGSDSASELDAGLVEIERA